MINNKVVTIATLNWFGRDVEDKRIQNILFPPEIDSVWLRSIFSHGKETTKLPKPVNDIKTQKDALGVEGEGDIIPWPHDQIRLFCEKESTMDEAFVVLYEDENVLSYSTTTMPNDMSQLAEDVCDNNDMIQRNKRNEESVVRNNYIASEQAKSYVNYAGNEREMMNVMKEYASLIQLCTKLIKKDFGDADDNTESKCLFLRYQAKKWKVLCTTSEELVNEARDIIGNDVILSYGESEHERQKDFDVLTEFNVVDCEKVDEFENTI